MNYLWHFTVDSLKGTNETIRAEMLLNAAEWEFLRKIHEMQWSKKIK